MKSFLKAIALILLLATLSACSQSADNNSDNSFLAYDPSFIEGENIDMQGKEFNIVGITHYDGDFALLPEYGETALGDSLLKRYVELGEKFNCEIIVKSGNMSGLMMNISAGLPYADLMNEQLSNINPYRKVGVFEDLVLVDGIDIRNEEKYGTSTLLEAMTFGNSVYGMMAMQMGEPLPFICGYMWYFPSNVSSISMADPHELLEQKMWTWSEYEKMLEAYTDISSADEEYHKYGTYLDSGYPEYFTIPVISSNGVNLVTRDGEVYNSNATNPNVIEALEWINKLIVDGDLLVSKYGNHSDALAFCDGKYLFATEYNWLGISKMNGWIGKTAQEQFNWITFPHGPKGDPGIVTSFISWGTNYYFIPITADITFAGYVTSELFEPLYTDGGLTWKDVLYSENFWDSTSFDLFMEMFNYPTYDYYSLLPVASSVNKAIADAVSGAKTPNQAMSEIDDMLQDSLNNEFAMYFK